MHFSQCKARSCDCMSSVRPSVTLLNQDHIGWKSWKLTEGTICLTPSLFVAKRPSPPTPRGTWVNFEETRGESLGKVVCRSTKAAIYLKCVKIEEKLLRRAYRNSPTLFRTVPFPTPYAPKYFGYPLLSQEPIKLRTSNLAVTFTGPSEQKPIKNLEKRERGRIQGLSNVGGTPYYLRNG